MKATCWHGKSDMRVDEVPDPKILNSRDAIVKITSTAICGSDLHLFDGVMPTMQTGDILGHEFMGEVVEVGKGVNNLTVGDRVVVPFPISCGNCFYCQKGMYSLCENSNPNAYMAEQMMGHPIAGIFGYSHLLGGICRRAGGICARALCRCRPDQNPGRYGRRAGAVPVRHFPDRVHGGGELQHSARRYHCRVGLRPGRTVRDEERVSAGRGARDRH